MREIENFYTGVAALRSNKLRTALTMLGIIFGVGAVIAMLSIGEGARQETLDQIELLGTNNIIINTKKLPAGDNVKGSNFSKGLTIADAEALVKINPLIESAAYHRSYKAKVMYKSEFIETKMIGSTPDYPDIYNLRISSGRFFGWRHIDNFANVCVIGAGVENEFFRFRNPIGEKIKLNGLWFTIIGVVGEKSVTSAGVEKLGIRNFNMDIYVPFTTLVYKVENVPEDGKGNVYYWWDADRYANVIDRSSVDQISAKVIKGGSVVTASDLVKKILKRRHYEVADYEVVIPEELLRQKQKTQRIFNVVMGAIAGISLLVGGIGIMNIMLANILERTREIGIRRAMGATRKNILNQFLYEAIFISIVGGILGIITGYILTSLITTYAEWRTVITPISIVLAFVVSLIVGVVFGIYPAKKAAEKDPIESLRYE